MLKKNSQAFITFRRHYLDELLFGVDWHGKVLDIGGKKRNKRGRFRPPLDRVETWEYVNIDSATEPDFLCSADDIPVPDGSYDIVLMTEVLEHLEKPVDAIKEAHRVLRPEGETIITMPFLYAVHADPQDFQRWTADKIRLELKNTGFSVKLLKPMGGMFAVIYDLLYISMGIASRKRDKITNRIVRRFIMPIIRQMFFFLDARFQYKSQWITTGWFVVAFKG